MKRAFIATPLLCIVIAFTVQAVPQPGGRTMYVAERSGLNLREKPDASSTRILSVPFGTRLDAIDTRAPGEAEGLKATWYRTSYNGKEGYLLGAYLVSMPVPQSQCGSFNCYFAWLTGAKDAGKMREILEQKYSISHSEGGKTCASGYVTGFGELPLKDAFLLVRILYGKEFPALNQKFSSIAKTEKDGSVTISLSKRINGGVKDIILYSRGNSVGFDDIDSADPCEP